MNNDRPKLPIIPNDILVDQKITYLMNAIKKKVPVSIAQVSSGAPAADVDECCFKGEIVNTTSSVSIGGMTMPWVWVSGGINTNFQFGTQDGTAPVVVPVTITEGDSVSVAYTSGTVSYDGGVHSYNSGGDPTAATGSTLSGFSSTFYPTLFCPRAAITGANGNAADGGLGLGGLIGAFLDVNGGIVGVVSVGNGGAFKAPKGAVSFQLGINDDQYFNNSGTLVMSVTVQSAQAAYKVGDFVISAGLLYECITDNKAGILPPNTTYWKHIAILAAATEDTLTLSDVTTDNVSITKHGFAPKAPNDATKFLDGTGAYDTVKDSDLSTSDITTNDVSITKHGFAPKAPNDVAKFLNGAGAWTVPVGSGVSAAVSFSSANSPATLNLSTQGTTDWFIMNGVSSLNPPRTAALGSVHSKALGGWIKDSWDWFLAAGGGISVAGSGAIAMTSSVSDDSTTPLSSVTPNATAIGGNLTTILNCGYRFRVPADATSRTLRLNMAVNGVKAQIKCRMMDGSIADQTTNLDAVTDNTFVQKEITVQYNASSNGSEMVVEVRIVTNYSTSTHTAAVYFISATLA